MQHITEETYALNRQIRALWDELGVLDRALANEEWDRGPLRLQRDQVSRELARLERLHPDYSDREPMKRMLSPEERRIARYQRFIDAMPIGEWEQFARLLDPTVAAKLRASLEVTE